VRLAIVAGCCRFAKRENCRLRAGTVVFAPTLVRVAAHERRGRGSQKRLSQKHPGRSQARKIGVAPFPKFHSPNGLGRASGRDLLLGFVRCSAAGEVGTSNRLVRDVPVGVSFG
jgi:hypothetical protein